MSRFSALLHSILASPRPAARALRRAAAAGVLLAGLALSSACGDDDGAMPPPPPPPEDMGVDAGRGFRTTFPGLDGPVEVVRDDRGMVHIYASTVHDLTFVQGYMMAYDRFAQMELTRRAVTGRVAEFAAALSPGSVNDDIDARWQGFKRAAERIYPTITGDEKIAIDAFSAGVSLYISDYQAGRFPRRRGWAILEAVVASGTLNAWQPTDTLAIGRYLSHALSFSADDEIGLTRARDRANTAFPEGNPRRGIFRDLWAFEPVEPVYTVDGFPNATMDSGSRSLLPPGAPRTPRGPAAGALRTLRVSDAVLDDAIAFFDRADRLIERIAPVDRGSNNWVVSGAHTETGHSLLANDPHLALTTPPLFWYAHLNTKRAGGDLNVSGLSLVGVPGIIIGYNDDIAWGVTTANHDVTDVYEETITPGAGGAPDTVAFEGRQVPIEIVEEVIGVAGGPPRTVRFERVPHHGLIVPTIRDGEVVRRTETTALSVRWTGDDPSSELTAFFRLNRATSIDEALEAIEAFEVGAQNFVFVERGSDRVAWSTQARVPVRPPACMTYDPRTQTGLGPMFVYPGDGTCEWLPAPLSDRYIPHADRAVDPSIRFLATANQDPVGATRDGNPLDDVAYVGWDYDIGHRQARIVSELTRLADRGRVTVDEMKALQGDLHSPLGAMLRDALVASLDRALEESRAPGAHPALADELSMAGAAGVARLQEARDRLAAWRFTTEPAVEGSPTAAQIEESVATVIFNTALVRILRGMLDDEIATIMRRPWGQPATKALTFALLAPSRMATFDADTGESILWDDTRTPAIETKDEIILRAFLAALQANATSSRLGPDMSAWRWGRLHTLRLPSLIPEIDQPLALPPTTGEFAAGWPRHGDLWGVDASNFDAWTSSDNFAYGSGPQQRLVVEMTDTGPRIWNALPGGNVFDPRSPHYADEIELWRRNQAPALYFTDADVMAHAEETWRFTSAAD